jgi:hypothetical protein
VESAALGKAGIRNLEKKVAGIARLAADPVLVGLAREFLGGEARLVRALFFDKTPGRNWAVPWLWEVGGREALRLTRGMLG